MVMPLLVVTETQVQEVVQGVRATIAQLANVMPIHRLVTTPPSTIVGLASTTRPLGQLFEEIPPCVLATALR